MEQNIVIGRKIKTYRGRILKKALKSASTRIKVNFKYSLKHKKKSIFYLIIVSLCTIGLFRVYDDIEQNLTSYITHADTSSSEVNNYIDFHDAIVKSTITHEPNTLASDNKIDGNVVMKDKRIIILDEYFKANNSPLYGTAHLFVGACDKYGAPKDCISVVAIAKNETDLCKYHISAQMYNCWGFGGAGVYRVTFKSWEQSIYRVTDVLVNQYGVEYMQDPTKMEKTFCGTEDPACENWGNKIKTFMKQIDDFSAETGLGRLTDLNNQ